MLCADAEERLHTLPARWTDLVPPDPFVAIAAGRSYFRTRDLLLLVELIHRLLASAPSGASQPCPAAASEIAPGVSRE